ncbi:hypothetical protein C2845_PM07G38180 [Panicum miliaceum]|uniref:Uncharacterized protein n=1 Tax=Panicum miliaceum TaxID=4540 RepID=A0A3L6SN61_PANMI|nr:hypothetical protein C2845_PM07G38180 [Panicum miliaceum]
MRRRDRNCSAAPRLTLFPVTTTVMPKVEEELTRALLVSKAAAREQELATAPPLSMAPRGSRSSQGRDHHGGVAPSRAMENPWQGRSISLRWRRRDPSHLYPPQATAHCKLDLLGSGGAWFLVLIVV